MDEGDSRALTRSKALGNQGDQAGISKLLVVQPYGVDGKTPDGFPLLAVDVVGSGRGECVMITSDGRLAREVLNTDATPVRWTVIGIKD